MANICQCGCGESLPEESTRQYKRGHKNRIDNPEQLNGDNADSAPDDFVPLTIDDAARDTPDDPEPSEAPEYKPKTSVRITAAMRRDIEGKLAFGFVMLGQTWSLVDQPCGTTLIDIGPDMAKKYTPLICQSPDVVKWITKSGNFMRVIDALVATLPLIQIFIAHHLTRSLVSAVPQHGAMPAPSEYVVQ